MRQFRKNLSPKQATNGERHQIPPGSHSIFALTNHGDIVTVLLHYHAIEIFIYEAGLYKQPLTTDPLSSSKRLELLCACLAAAKSYFELFFSIPAESYVSVSLVSWSHLSYSLSILHMLSNFDHPDWNLAYVQETIDYTVVFGRLIENLEKLTTLSGYEKLDIFSRSAKWMKIVKGYVEAKMAGLQTTGFQEGDQMLDFGAIPIPGTEDLTDFFQFLDDAWMTDGMGTLDFQVNTMTGT